MVNQHCVAQCPCIECGVLRPGSCDDTLFAVDDVRGSSFLLAWNKIMPFFGIVVCSAAWLLSLGLASKRQLDRLLRHVLVYTTMACRCSEPGHDDDEGWADEEKQKRKPAAVCVFVRVARNCCDRAGCEDSSSTLDHSPKGKGRVGS